MEKKLSAVVYKTGSIRNLTWMEQPIPKPQEGEVLVQVKAFGLNFADIFAILGLYSATPPVPFTPGLEFSGVVVEKGPGTHSFQIGDKIMGATRFGGYSSYISQKEIYLFPLPIGWSFEEGAAFPVQALTAYYALFPLGNLKKGETVLIQSAAGGVGLLANQFAKRIGATTIGVVGDPSKIPYLIENNTDYCIVRDKNFLLNAKTILKNTPLNLVLECVGGKTFLDCYELLSPMGRMVVYGSAQYAPSGYRINPVKTAYLYLTRPKLDPMQLITENKSILGFNLIWLWDYIDVLRDCFYNIMQMNPQPQRIGMIVNYKDIHKALYAFQTGTTIGKVVVHF